jgi:uncharacterized protein YndB with AHSA1/START domain
MDAKTHPRLKLTFPSDREIAIERDFDAPRELVWKAWTRPEYFRRWYGCDTVTLSVCDIDLRVGGAYRYVMRGADGMEFVMSGIYREVVPPRRLVYTERFNDDPNKEALVTFTLEERAGRTTMRNTILYALPDHRDIVLKMGVEQGMAASLDRLAEVIRTIA